MGYPNYNKPYPHHVGDFTVLGPEIFTNADGSVICWKGVNYVPQEEPEQLVKDPKFLVLLDENTLI